MPKISKKFRNKYKITSAVMIASLVLSSPIGASANEVEGSENNQVVVEASQEVVEEVVVEEEAVVEEEKVVEQEQEVVKDDTKDEVETVSETQEVESGLNDQDYEQLGYAIEEMRIAIDLVDNADLTDEGNFERLSRFSEAASQRLESIDVQSADESQKPHIDWLKDSIEEVRLAKASAGRLIHAMNNVNTVFDAARRDTLKNKQVVLDILGDVANQERLNVNTYTSASAYNMYHEFYAVWQSELDEAVTQLGYAIEEVREAVNCKDNKDLTVPENLERIQAFAQAATDRLDGLYVLDGLENYSEHIANLRANLELVNQTIDLATQIRSAMDSVINAFEKGLSREEKIEALDALGTLVDENKYEINTYTSYTAMKLYHDYYAILDEVGDGTGDDNNQVTPEPEPETPGEGDGTEDDDDQETPGEDDGTEDDSIVDDKDEADTKPSTDDNKNPQTNDASILGYVALGLSSIVGLAATRKRK
ncbi:MAG: hypothetical protein RSC26_15640 [Terrisporobacter sp.]